jgi:hypothetical protein
MQSDDTEHPEPVEEADLTDDQIQHVDYLLWSHGAANDLRARVEAELRGERPPEWAVDAEEGDQA